MENSRHSMNKPKKPQESFLASTGHNVVQSTSMKNGTDETLSTCEKIRKMPTTDSLIEKSIFLDYEKDSTTKPLDYGKLSSSINQPRKLEERFLASRHNSVQSTSKNINEILKEMLILDEEIRKMPTTQQLIEQSIFGKRFDYEEEEDFFLIPRSLDHVNLSTLDYANDSIF